MASRQQAKGKGSSFERLVAKELTNWWGEGDFHRTPGSGSLHWADDNRVSGDIIPPKGSTFNFSVECKDHATTKLDQLVSGVGGAGEFKDFWKQCTGDARNFDKIPMLVFKCPRVKPWVVLPYVPKVFNSLAGKFPVIHTVISFKNIREEDQEFYVLATTLNGLTTTFTPSSILAMYKDCKWDKLK